MGGGGGEEGEGKKLQLTMFVAVKLKMRRRRGKLPSAVGPRELLNLVQKMYSGKGRLAGEPCTLTPVYGCNC